MGHGSPDLFGQLFSRHVDRLLGDFGAGDLSPAKTRRLLEHAKACERCGALVNQVLAAQRVLQGSLFEPSEQEQAAWSASAAAVVAASAAKPEKSSSKAWFLAFAAAATCLALFVLWPRPQPFDPDEFGVRGDGKGAQASVRVYCVPPSGDLVELDEGKACKVGHSLGFAAGANLPLRHLRLKVGQDGASLASGDFAVAARPGAEDAVELSVKLERAGRVQVDAAFAEKPEAFDSPKVRLVREVVVEAK